MEDLIYNLIATAISCHHLEVTGDGTHFDAVVVSDAFNQLGLVARHRIIYQALGTKMGNEIHALSMQLYTLDEWRQRTNDMPN